MTARDGGTSAWWRHEHSITRALAAAQYHSAGTSAGPLSNNAPRLPGHSNCLTRKTWAGCGLARCQSGRGPQTRIEKSTSGLCPLFSHASLVSVERDAPLDPSSVFRIVEEQKKKRMKTEEKMRKLLATRSSSPGGTGHGRGADGAVLDV